MKLPERPTLDDVRAFIGAIAETLDPKSRYVSELLAIVDKSTRVGDLVRRLDAGSRGARHAGLHVFERMTLEQKLRCNLITNETVLFRFSEGEWDVLIRRLLTHFVGRTGKILSAPCSHGEEPFSIAAACLQLGLDFDIDAIDIQPEVIAEAKTGKMTMGFPVQYLDTPAIVGKKALERIRFAVGDLLGELPAGTWDLIVCRNFLGYFKEALALETARKLARRVEPGGALFVDSFCVTKFPALAAELDAEGLKREAAFPVFLREKDV